MPKSQTKGRFMGMESSKRQKVSISTWFSHIQASAALGNPSAPADALPPNKGQEPISLLLSREAELQEKITFLEVAFYLQHEPAGCRCRMWCRITTLSIQTTLKRCKVMWVFWDLAISKSWMPNLHSQGYKLPIAVQAPAWLKKNKPVSALWNPQELIFSLHWAELNPLICQKLLRHQQSSLLTKQHKLQDLTQVNAAAQKGDVVSYFPIAPKFSCAEPWF